MRNLVILSLSFVLSSALVGCGSDSSSSSAPSGAEAFAKCGAGGSGGGGSTGPDACGTCVTNKCGSEINACFSSSGACIAWANAGCKGLPDATCISCTEKLGACESSQCATECKSDTGTKTDTGTPDLGASDGGGECKTLALCCPTLTGDLKTGCESSVASGADSTCAAVLSGFKSAGYCK